jgi:hypothetical protein
MAQLKVKQISDIGPYVQGLIDNDTDQNAGLIDALEASVDSLENATGGATGDLVDSVDSLEAVASAAITSIDALQSADLVINASIDSLEVVDGNQSTSIANNASSIATNATGLAAVSKDLLDNDADNLALTASVDSLELLAGGTIIADLATSIADNDTRVDSILNNANVDLDQFTEVVAYVNSLDVLQGGDLTDGLAALNSSVDSLEVVDAAQNDSIDALQSADVVIDASIDSLETVASAAITSIDALESADVVINASIDSLETLAIDAFGAGVRIHQMGTVTGVAAFTIPTAVDFSDDADCVVFVNGKGEQMKMATNTNGWTSTNGTAFTLTGIGYDIDAEDDVYVIAPYAGDAETTGTGGGEDYEDFFNARSGKGE